MTNPAKKPSQTRLALSVSGIPRGIEVLVKKAAVDAAFRQALVQRRSAAAVDIGLTLTPAETVMLDAVPPAQLQAIIATTHVSEHIKPAFLGKVAAAMLLALGVATVSDAQFVSLGEQPNVPPPATAPTSQPASRPTSQATTAASQPAMSAEAIDKLVAQLDDDNYQVRVAAQQQLRSMLPAAKPMIEKVLATATLSVEQRTRLNEMIAPPPPEEVPDGGVLVVGIRVRF